VEKLRIVVSLALLSVALVACNGGNNGGSGAAGNGGGPSSSGSSGGASGGGSGSDNNVFLNVVPPGSNGNSAGGVPGSTVKYPQNFDDQLSLYGDLSYAQPSLKVAPCTPPTDISQHATSSDLACNYFKHEGLTPDTVVSTETVTAPSGDKVTITRDNWGVPFIDALNRSDAMYGVGYANAEDRLWLDDVLRHIGRGTITSYLGDAPGLTSFDANLAVTAGYSEQELTDMFNATVEQLGPLGVVVKNDANQFVAGINAYIATLAPSGSGQPSPKTPPEYFTLKPGGYPPAPFTVNDIIASAILIQSQFATGGGGEVTNENLLQKLDPGFTAGTTTVPVAACELWRDLRHANDPETPTTIDTRFATQSPTTLDETCPQTLPAGVAVWDVGSLKSRAVLQITALTSQASLSGIQGLLLSILPGLQPLLPARTVNANGTSSVAPIRVAGLGDAL